MRDSPRINLFALPSQTSLLFVGILVVLGVPLLSSAIRPSLLLLPVLPVGSALLTLWDFLREPDRVQQRLRATRLAPDDPVVRRLRAVAQGIGMDAPPVLLATAADLPGPFVFGTWRRRYLALPCWLHDKVAGWERAGDRDRLQRFDYVLHHELAHFANGDVWRAGLSRSFLKMTILLLAALWLMALTMPFVYWLMRPHVRDLLAAMPPALLDLLPAEMAAALQDPPLLTSAGAAVFWLTASMAYLPLIGGAFFLWLRDWNLLLRVRELYCDARAAAWTRSVELAGETISWFSLVSAMRPAPETPRWRDRLRTLAVPGLSFPAGSAVRGWMAPGPQPMNEERRSTLEEPHRIYGSPRAIGLRAAVLTLLFQLLLASLYAPSRAGVGADVVLVFGFCLMGFALTPATLAAPSGPEAAVLARRAFAWFLLVVTGTVALLLAVALWAMLALPGALDMTLYAIAMVVPAEIEAQIDPAAYAVEVALGALLSYGVAVPILLYGALRLDQRLKRGALAWSGAPWLARRAPLLLAGITLGIGAVLWLGTPLLLTALALPFTAAVELRHLAGFALALILAGGGALWAYGQRRHAGRCPHCGAGAPGPFQLGARCPACARSLHPWLLAGPEPAPPGASAVAEIAESVARVL